MTVEHPLTFRGLDENSAMRAILEGTASETGERFFTALVENISKALGTYSSWVTEYIKDSRHLRSLAFWVDGRLVENFNLVHYADNMMVLFPNNATVKAFSAISWRSTD